MGFRPKKNRQRSEIKVVGQERQKQKGKIKMFYLRFVPIRTQMAPSLSKRLLHILTCSIGLQAAQVLPYTVKK